MIKIIVGLLLLISLMGTGGYSYINKLTNDNSLLTANNLVLENTIINTEADKEAILADAQIQIDSVLNSFIELESKYSKTQEKRNALIKQIRNNKDILNKQESIAAIDDILNSGSSILLDRIEKLTSDYYSKRSGEDRGTDELSATKAKAVNDEEDNLEGL